MQLLCDHASRVPVLSLYTDAPTALPEVRQGEVWPVEIGVIERIAGATTARLWEPIDISDWTIRIAIGDVSSGPVAGTGTLSWDNEESNPVGTSPTGQDIEDALNAMGSISSAGGVVVEEVGTRLFAVTWNENGDRDLIVGDASNYAPLSQWSIGTLITGTGDRKATQLIRLNQNPAAFANVTVDSDSAAVTVDVLTTGGSGANHKIRITLPKNTYDGQFTLNIGSEESGFISFDIGADEMQTILEAMTSVGESNVSVVKETEFSWVIMFIGAHADEDMGAITGDASTLRVLATKSGNLDLRVPGIQLLLDGGEFIQTNIEIEGTPSGGYPRKLLTQKINVYEGLIDPENMPPQPTPGTKIVQTDSIGSGVDFVAITFATPLATPPSIVIPVLHVPEGEAGFDIFVRKGSVTETGYIVDFTGTTDSADYEITTEATI